MNDLNPYRSASFEATAQQSPQQLTKGPGIALIVVASISILMLSLALIIDVILAFMLFSGGNQIPNAEAEQVQLLVRAIWSFVILVASCFCLWSGINMVRVRGYGICRFGAILAVVPCVGPCCLIGIPFGIWALVVLSKPEVRASFPD